MERCDCHQVSLKNLAESRKKLGMISDFDFKKLNFFLGWIENLSHPHSNCDIHDV